MKRRNLKKPSRLERLKQSVGSALQTAGTAVLDAKTPSPREIGNFANAAQKSLRHRLAELIDSE